MLAFLTLYPYCFFLLICMPKRGVRQQLGIVKKSSPKSTPVDPLVPACRSDVNFKSVDDFLKHKWRRGQLSAGDVQTVARLDANSETRFEQ